MANVIIAEDETIIAKDLEMTIEKMGHRVACISSSGEEIISKSYSLNPSLIILDIKLKGKIDGIAAAKEIRKKISTPIIFITGNSNMIEVEKEVDILQPFAVIDKPFRESELRRTIASVLN